MIGDWTGEDIRRERERAGLSYRKLADQIGVSAAAVSQWESGATTPTAGHLRRLQEVLAPSANGDQNDDMALLLMELRDALEEAKTRDVAMAHLTELVTEAMNQLGVALDLLRRIDEFVDWREAALQRGEDAP